MSSDVKTYIVRFPAETCVVCRPRAAVALLSAVAWGLSLTDKFAPAEDGKVLSMRQVKDGDSYLWEITFHPSCIGYGTLESLIAFIREFCASGPAGVSFTVTSTASEEVKEAL